MEFIIHRAKDRGYANHGWLESYHSFSFANYYDPNKMNFGVLRVLNDDRIAGGTGFGAHPHDNMEIISIPLSGGLMHKDSIGSEYVIQSGDIQVMSAGTGIVHSEMNANQYEEAKFLQIWIIPAKRNVEPRYQQMTLPASLPNNELVPIVGPEGQAPLWIHQHAWLSMAQFEAGATIDVGLNDSDNGVYLFVLDGEVKVEEHALAARDAIGLLNFSNVKLDALTSAKILFIEVPLSL